MSLGRKQEFFLLSCTVYWLSFFENSVVVKVYKMVMLGNLLLQTGETWIL